MPKVFVSYSWKSKETVAFVINLVEQLIDKDVEVVFDRYDLKPGADKFKFMESAVRGEDIDKVLIICDAAYKAKADGREGGVGDETCLITPELYASVDQQRYIPIILEKDDRGKPILPIYLEARIGLDFSVEEEFDEYFELLLRNLYGVPALKRPKRGTPPDFATDESVESSKLRRKLQEIQRLIRQGKNHRAQLSEFHEDYIEAVLGHCRDKALPLRETGSDYQRVISGFEELRKVRDHYYELLMLVTGTDDDMAVFSAELLKELRERSRHQFDHGIDYNMRYDRVDFLLWEMVVGTVAIMLKGKRYKEAGRFIRWTFFLCGYQKGPEEPNRITVFMFESSILEGIYKPTTEWRDKISLSAKMLLERDWKPALSDENLMIADLVIHQVLDTVVNEYDLRWHPMTAVYSSGIRSFWRRMLSREQCGAFVELFEAESVEGLVNKLGDCVSLGSLRLGYKSTGQRALDCIHPKEIGSMP